MRLAIAAFAAGVIVSACAIPTRPTEAAAWKPAHHNIPATFVGHETGPLIWLCATQPREYVTVGGQHQLEEDPLPAIRGMPDNPDTMSDAGEQTRIRNRR